MAKNYYRLGEKALLFVDPKSGLIVTKNKLSQLNSEEENEKINEAVSSGHIIRMTEKEAKSYESELSAKEGDPKGEDDGDDEEGEDEVSNNGDIDVPDKSMDKDKLEEIAIKLGYNGEELKVLMDKSKKNIAKELKGKM